MKIDTYKVTDEFGKLKFVISHEFRFEGENDMKSAIQLIFENGEIFHEALPNTDEMTCNTELIDTYDVKDDISQNSPWDDALGKSACWLWSIKNQQGYDDAVQYSFGRPNEKIIIQLMVQASEIETHVLSKKL